MSRCCSENEGETLLFTCAGTAYSGQVANRAGVDLMKRGVKHIFCEAAIAANRPNKVERARKGACRVVIDGHEDHCAKRILKAAGMPSDLRVGVTTLGIEKKRDEPPMLTNAKHVVDAVTVGRSS